MKRTLTEPVEAVSLKVCSKVSIHLKLLGLVMEDWFSLVSLSDFEFPVLIKFV